MRESDYSEGEGAIRQRRAPAVDQLQAEMEAALSLLPEDNIRLKPPRRGLCCR